MKKTKSKARDLIGQIIIASALIGLLILGYVSLKSSDSNKFRSIERLPGDHIVSAFHTPKV
jgi:hypothetical protein